MSLTHDFSEQFHWIRKCQHQSTKLPEQASEVKETSTLNTDLSKVKEDENARVENKVEEKCENGKEDSAVKTNKQTGASHDDLVNDELGDIVVKVGRQYERVKL